MACRIDEVGAGAQHGDRAGAAGERALVRGAVDAEREAARDGPARFRQRPRERPRVREAAGGGIARTDDRDRGAREHLAHADRVQQRRRVGRAQQLRRVVGVGHRDQVVVVGAGPVERTGDPALALGIAMAQRGGELRAGDVFEQAAAGLEDRVRQAEGLEQRACRDRADARRQREPQPAGEIVWIALCERHGVTAPSGVRDW